MKIFNWLFGNRKPSKKEVVDQYKINDDRPASLETNIEDQIMFKRDMTGLLEYFKQMPNMERIYNQLTHFIRNGYSVKKYLIEANILEDEEIRDITAKGFNVISKFLEDMLKIQENDELRKDYNACLEAISILVETSTTSINDENNLKNTNTMNRRNFYLSPKLYGQNLTIKIYNQGFSYNHDKIVDANKKRFSKGGSAHKSWSENGFYSKTSGYPNWASEFIRNE